MHGKRSTWKWLAALIGVAMAGSWCPEALGQVETEQVQAEKEVRLEPLKSAPLEVLPKKWRIEQTTELPEGEVRIVEELMPELIGGLRPLLQEIRYPASARRNRIQGVVFLSFVVDEQGLVEQAVVEEGIGGGCDEEALRVVRLLRFKPGIQVELTPDGNFISKPVKVQMSLPITFRLK